MRELALRAIGLVSLALAACAPAQTPASLPPGAHVETLQFQRIVLRGTASAHPGDASCASAPASTPVYLQLNEETEGNIVLRPIRAAAVLHVEELATSRTWCVIQERGAGATIPGQFPQGVYAISVDGSRAAEPTPFEVAFERALSD
jgi:hypothetical protein